LLRGKAAVGRSVTQLARKESQGGKMWIALLITHGLIAFLLLGAITHQAVSVWAPARAGATNFIARYRAVGSAHYVNAVIVLYLVGATMGGILYTNYRISARLMMEQGHYWKSVGAFEIKEHLIAIGLAVLPAYWYFWQPSSDTGDLRTRKLLTTLLAFIIWWAFLAGHIANNIRGIGT
jgi:hypothetical protein